MTETTQSKPWGSYKVVFERNDFKVKYICIDKGHRISLQKHNKRSETWVVVKGHPVVDKGKTKLVLEPEQSIYIPVGEVHRVEAHTDDVRIIEVQHGICDEEDIERLEDDYASEHRRSSEKDYNLLKYR